jgi:hypothetical protein
MKWAVTVVMLAAALGLPGIAVAQTTVSDSCDVRFQSGTYVVASNHNGTDAAEAAIGSVCSDMVRQGAIGIAKDTRLDFTHQVCSGSPSGGALVIVASTYDDWQTGTELCNSEAWMSPAKTIAESQAAETALAAFLAQLDASWRNQVGARGQAGAPQSPPSPMSPPIVSVPNGGVVDDYVDGEFTGWSGDTVFRLRNGQIWQQTEYKYAYRYAYGPRVLIYPTGGGWRMQVEGMDDTIAVQRLR